MLHKPKTAPAAPFRWTDENVETLKALWTEGRSGTDIAAALGGGVTRNAVIGKASRLKLPSHSYKVPSAALVEARAARAIERVKAKPAEGRQGGKGSKGQPKVQFIRARVDAKTKPRVLPLPDVTHGVDVTALCGILELTNDTCLWPIGDPFDADFGFCGRRPQDGSVYCGEHHRRAHYRPAPASAEGDA